MSDKRQQAEWKLRNPERMLLYYARQRAKEQNVICTITRADISIPEFCPALGIKLVVNAGGKGFKDNSPSIDRVDPSKGYVAGNVAVISFRANRIKHNATVEELKSVANWLERTNNEYSS